MLLHLPNFNFKRIQFLNSASCTVFLWHLSPNWNVQKLCMWKINLTTYFSFWNEILLRLLLLENMIINNMPAQNWLLFHNFFMNNIFDTIFFSARRWYFSTHFLYCFIKKSLKFWIVFFIRIVCRNRVCRIQFQRQCFRQRLFCDGFIRNK